VLILWSETNTLSGWMNEWMNEWVNEWIKYLKYNIVAILRITVYRCGRTNVHCQAAIQRSSYLSCFIKRRNDYILFSLVPCVIPLSTESYAYRNTLPLQPALLADVHQEYYKHRLQLHWSQLTGVLDLIRCDVATGKVWNWGASLSFKFM